MNLHGIKGRGIVLAGTFGALFFCRAAAAQEQTTEAPAPAPVVDTPPTTTTTSSDLTPLHDPMAPSENVTPPVKSCGLLGRPCSYPHLAVALEGGGSSFNEANPFSFGTGTGSVSALGPSWGARVGIEVLSWLAFDGHYIGMNNHGSGAATPTGDVSLFTNAIVGEVRLTVPIKYVQPYFFTGAGYYTTAVTGTSTAKNGSPLTGSSELGVPVGIGVGVPIAGAISIGGELAYHRLFGEAFAADDEIGGGDLTTFNAVVRARF